MRDTKQPFGELFLDEDGEPHFVCHTADEDFGKTREAIEKFIGLLQRQLTNEAACPFHPSHIE